jgi:tight adherence protein C
MQLSLELLVAAAFTLSLSTVLAVGGMGLMERRSRLRRVKAVVSKKSSRPSGAASQAWQANALSLMRACTQRMTIMKTRQVEDTRRLLLSAGHRSRDALIVFTFFKMMSPLIFLGGSVIFTYGFDAVGHGALVDLGVVLVAGLLGSKLPDMIVKRRAKARMESIRKSFPDALDMLVICAEAGLASDSAIKRVVQELSRRSSELGDELHQTALELSFMPERRQALENLALRVPLTAIQSFTSTLIQAEKYGTPLARAFKVLSQEQRNERMMRAEEKAGRLPATMTVPMMLFILPALFIVLIGPAVLDIMDNYISR